MKRKPQTLHTDVLSTEDFPSFGKRMQIVLTAADPLIHQSHRMLACVQLQLQKSAVILNSKVKVQLLLQVNDALRFKKRKI